MWNEEPGPSLTVPHDAAPDVRADAMSGAGAAADDMSSRRRDMTMHQSPLMTTSGAHGRNTAASPDVLPLVDIRLTVRERPFRALVNLRGDSRDAAFVHTSAALLGCPLPLRPNGTTVGPVYRVIWTGPDEWWVQSHDPQSSTRASQLEADLRAAFDGQFATATDIGSGYTTLEIGGALARAVLARGCPLDLHPRVFAADACAQSHFFKADIVLILVEGDLFEMIVRRSFARYVAEILHDAAQPLLAS